jgi:RNA polymerase sigma-70 factor (ECF subfamily)
LFRLYFVPGSFSILGVDVESPYAPPQGHAPFRTTCWHVVLSSVDATDDATAYQALSQLCGIYWRPVLAYITHKGHSGADAEDLTQDFFAYILSGNFLKHAHPERGRFRALLCIALEHFLHDINDRQNAIKRGGNRRIAAWSDWMKKAPSQFCLPATCLEHLPPDKVYDLRWAATIAERALRRLREECEKRGRARVFDTLVEYLTVDVADQAYVGAGTILGIAETSIKTLVHRLRRRYGTLLYEEVAHTIVDPATVEEEVRYLCSALVLIDNWK